MYLYSYFSYIIILYNNYLLISEAFIFYIFVEYVVEIYY